jgi:hypothetical protein
MPGTKSSSALASLSALLAKPAAFEDFVAKLSARDKANVERHLAAADAETTPDHAKLYKRLIRSLFTLAPHAVSTVGQQAAMFFIADGKYKLQMFALEDPRDGRVLVYCNDVLKDAIKQGILAGSVKATPTVYPLASDAKQSLTIEPLDSASIDNPHAWYKSMLGWNRKALRITLPVTASDEQAKAVELMAALSLQPKGK